MILKKRPIDEPEERPKDKRQLINRKIQLMLKSQWFAIFDENTYLTVQNRRTKTRQYDKAWIRTHSYYYMYSIFANQCEINYSNIKIT